MAPRPLDLAEKLAGFDEPWSPKVVAVARGLVKAMLIEPAGVVNTGDAGGELTADYDDSLAS